MLRNRMGVLGALTLAVLVLTSGCSKGTSSFTQPGAAAAASTERSFEVTPTPLHDPKVPGITIDNALTAIGRPIALPPTSIAGKTSKVLLVKNGADFVLGILFESGLELRVATGEVDYAAEMARYRENGAPFSDGEEHRSLQTIAGKVTKVTLGGDIEARGSTRAIPSSAAWNQNGLTYAIYDPNPDVSRLSRLTEVVEATK